MINRLRTALLSALLLSPLALADPDAGASDNALDEAVHSWMLPRAVLPSCRGSTMKMSSNTLRTGRFSA